MTSKLKPLYIGISLAELNKLAEVKFDNKSSATVYIKSIDTLLKNANLAMDTGDEERAYVLYMKYLTIVQWIRKTPDYKKAQEYYAALIGSKAPIDAMDKAELLGKSLRDRYEEKEAAEVVKKLESINSVTDKGQDIDVKSEPIIKQEEVKPVKEVVKVAPPHAPASVAGGVVTCTSLYRLLTQQPPLNIVIMDVRPVSDYEESHIRYEACISIPTHILLPGSTPRSLDSNLPPASRTMWQQRAQADHIVLVDWLGAVSDLDKVGPAKILKDAIYKWDISVALKSEPVLLEGGYEDWLLTYPTLTTNANVSRQSTQQQLVSFASLDSIDYDVDLTFLRPPAPPLEIQAPPTQAWVSPPLSVSEPVSKSVSGPVSTSVSGPVSGPVSTSVNGPVSTSVSTPVSSATPAVDRSKKPAVVRTENSKPDHNKQTAELHTDHASDQNSVPSNGRNQGNRAHHNLDPESGSERIRRMEEEVEQMRQLKTREAKDIADLMRRKRKMEEEMRSLVEEHARSVAAQEAAAASAAASSSNEVRREDVNRLEDLKRVESRKVADLMRLRRKLEDVTRVTEKEDIYAVPHKAAAETRKTDAAANGEVEPRPSHVTTNSQSAVKHVSDNSSLPDINTAEAAGVKVSAGLESIPASAITTSVTSTPVSQPGSVTSTPSKTSVGTVSKPVGPHTDAPDGRSNTASPAKSNTSDVRSGHVTPLPVNRDASNTSRADRVSELSSHMTASSKQLEPSTVIQGQGQPKAPSASQSVGSLSATSLPPVTGPSVTQPSVARPSLAQQLPPVARPPVTQQLPAGWEKRLESAIGRYYYIDHNTQTTHWNPPQQASQVTTARTAPAATNSMYTTKLKEEGGGAGGGLKRSHSFSNLAKEVESEVKVTQQPAVTGSVNRTLKPRFEPMVSRPARVRDFQPVSGSVAGGLTGLKNLGNTCYMNSTIQCLSNTLPLTSYFVNDLYVKDINRENFMGTGGDIAEEFAALIKALWSEQYRSIAPRDFKATVARYNDLFAGCSQQDSQELLAFLLDKLHEDLNKVRHRPRLPEQQNDNVPDIDAAEVAWKLHKKHNESIIVELFQGQFKSTVKCLTCGTKSVTFDAFMYLSLPIPSNSRCSLRECVMHFSKTERLSSPWKCPKCKTMREAEKQLLIWKLPPILLILLKRFYYKGMWREKITADVDFPMDNLDMSAHVAGPKTNAKYNLYGVSNHYGTMEGGHYTAYCRNANNNRWYKYDDHEVYEINRSSAQSSAAYILFYSCLKPHTTSSL